ncbi:hypothetical protein AGOR_G00057230 [Albula goreensis]|uniref:G-protein coupled receptors family 1 profile domain-containing protein n=1 Tax=Albula goreensis TaxID=1534307 RepID=A0A8T3DXQ9_9TELE|nr:hypothetical protein AGOR_G00057230 [Albula goreensis]
MLFLLPNDTQQNTTAPSDDLTDVYVAVRWIQLIMAVLSILGSGSIIVSAAFQNLIRTPEVQPLFLLSITDLLLGLSWLIGAVLFTQACESYVTCYNLHTIEQIFYMSSFFYTLNYIRVLYSGLKEKYHSRLNGYPSQFPRSTSSFDRVTAVLSSLLPVLLMVPVFTVGNLDRCYTNYSQPYKCLLMHTGPLYTTPGYSQEATACYSVHVYGIVVFLATFLFTFLGIGVLMGKARTLYKRCITSSGFLGGRQWATLRVLERRMLLYPSAFFFCWGPAIILASMILLCPQAVEGRVGVCLYILQALTSASQGLLNCLVYGWTQQRFRSLTSSALRDVNTQTPLLRSQKRGYSALRSTGSST